MFTMALLFGTRLSLLNGASVCAILFKRVTVCFYHHRLSFVELS